MALHRRRAARRGCARRGVGPRAVVEHDWTTRFVDAGADSITRPNSGAFGENVANVNRISALANATSKAISHATGPSPYPTTVTSTTPRSAKSTRAAPGMPLRHPRLSAARASSPQIVVLELRGDLRPRVLGDRRASPFASHPGAAPSSWYSSASANRVASSAGWIMSPCLPCSITSWKPEMRLATTGRPQLHRLQQHHAKRRPIGGRAVDICTRVVVQGVEAARTSPVDVVVHRLGHPLPGGGCGGGPSQPTTRRASSPHSRRTRIDSK